MKLSQLKTDNGADVVCELVELIDYILDEEIKEKIVAMFENTKETSVKDIVEFAVAAGTKLIPDLLKNKRKEVYKMLAILNETTVEEIAEQNFLITVKQIKEAFKDEDLMLLFK